MKGKREKHVSQVKLCFLVSLQRSSKLQDNNSSHVLVSNFKAFNLPDEQSDGQRGGLLVGSGSGLDGEGSSKFVQHPGLGRRQTLKMLLGSTGHFDLLTSERISQPFKDLIICKFKVNNDNIHVTLHFPFELVSRVVILQEHFEQLVDRRIKVGGQEGEGVLFKHVEQGEQRSCQVSSLLHRQGLEQGEKVSH